MEAKNIKKLYYSISEVSDITELKQYVLRYWETEFSELNPNKNKAGNRTYRSHDLDLILEIKSLKSLKSPPSFLEVIIELIATSPAPLSAPIPNITTSLPSSLVAEKTK